MQWHVNDLSLAGQSTDEQIFLAELSQLMTLRSRIPGLRDRLLVSRELKDRPVTSAMLLRNVVERHPDRGFRQLVFGWLANHGPFWDNDRQVNTDDYFEYDGHDVTGQGLGEAARRRIVGNDAHSFSFDGCTTPPCSHSPLAVQHGLKESPLGQVDIPNVCGIEALRAAALSVLPAPRNWNEALECLRARFPGLIFADTILAVLEREPYNQYIVERTEALLGVLQQFLESHDKSGNSTARTLEILTTHFQGGKAWFSDESPSNKAAFENELTFRDPTNPKSFIFCPWHGKIKTPQYRIHFEWPSLAMKSNVKVVYIGPKITKG